MKIEIEGSAERAGAAAAKRCGELLRQAIEERGEALVLLSTGASQFGFFEAIVGEDVEWGKVEMFHLDEYVGIAKSHKASFAGYLEERFTSKVKLKRAHLIPGESEPRETIAGLNAGLNGRRIDVGLIGIGENAHIAFNDPPADFETEDAYILVNLSESCKAQQVREGWFPDAESVCKQAVTMSCRQIMKCGHIISLVPYAVKAKAVADTLNNAPTPLIPATLLKTHPDFTLICDRDSAGLIEEKGR